MADTQTKPAPQVSANGRTEIRYKSPSGIDMDSVPWRLYDKAKKLFWDPADIDYSKDAATWAAMPDTQKLVVGGTSLGFMVGEEAVTLDILPLIRAISAEGRLEETMFLTTFAFEEAKHVEFFRRWANAVELDYSPFIEMQRAGGYGSGNGRNSGSVFDGELERIMSRLDTDRSPEAILDATLTYNQFVEGVLALGAYQMTDMFFAAQPGLPALKEGFTLIQRDERRHIAYGTYLARRIIAEHPETWDFVERRWAEITSAYLYVNGGPQAKALCDRRLEVLAVARGQRTEDIEHSDTEELEQTAE